MARGSTCVETTDYSHRQPFDPEVRFGARQGKSKLVLISNNCPALRKSEFQSQSFRRFLIEPKAE